MWSSHVSTLGQGTLRYTLGHASKLATFMDVLGAWRTDPGACAWFNDLLAAAPFAAFRWETPPVTASTARRVFEFVLLDSPSIVRDPSPEAFSEYFAESSTQDVIEFSNLGGDAVMVVPRRLAAPSAYGHLAAFVREAPEAQRLALWRAVGDAMMRRLGAEPVWLSTAGAGVSWLHVRLDDRPKYYGFAPFRTKP
jgi:hypothetical protein